MRGGSIRVTQTHGQRPGGHGKGRGGAWEAWIARQRRKAKGKRNNRKREV